MKPRHPIRLLAALCGRPRIGTAVVLRRAASTQAAPRTGSRFGGMSVPI